MVSQPENKQDGSVLQTLSQCCAQHGNHRTYWIAYSGGLDSHVLLSAANEIRQSTDIHFRVIHIHHGLSPHAASWSQHCAQVCKKYGMDYLERAIQIIPRQGESLEAAAREARYEAIAQVMQPDEILLTAHHQDDQAETFLLQLFRGAGPKGLAAMPACKPFAAGYQARPFLSLPRSVLEAYARERQLCWIEDESNKNRDFTRNFLRHDVLPLLTSRWPSAAAMIARSAAHCAETQHMLEKMSEEKLRTVQGSRPDTLSVARLLETSDSMRKMLLRAWIASKGHPLPDTKKLSSILRDVLISAPDRQPCVAWGQTTLRRYRDDLYLVTKDAHEWARSYSWDFQSPLELPSLGILKALPVPGRGFLANMTAVTVQFRQGGEIAHLPKRGRHTLKNLFQEWDVPPWERDRIPLIFHEERLIGAVGYFIDPDYAARADELGMEVKLKKASREDLPNA